MRTLAPTPAPAATGAPVPPPVAPVDVEIVVPVFNEERGLAASIRRLQRFLERDFPFAWQITIADNASTHRTPEIAAALADELRGVGFVRLAEKGRGRALWAAGRNRRARSAKSGTSEGVDNVPDPAVIAPEGELDVARADEFRAELGEAESSGSPELVVDLTQVSFIDSTGLGAIVDLHHRLRRSERHVSVVAPGGTAAALLLNLAGLRGRMPIYESRQAALGEKP